MNKIFAFLMGFISLCAFSQSIPQLNRLDPVVRSELVDIISREELIITRKEFPGKDLACELIFRYRIELADKSKASVAQCQALPRGKWGSELKQVQLLRYESGRAELIPQDHLSK